MVAVSQSIRRFPALLELAEEIMRGLTAMDQGTAHAEALLDDTTDGQTVEEGIGHARRTTPSGNEDHSLTAGDTELVALVEAWEDLEDVWKEMTKGSCGEGVSLTAWRPEDGLLGGHDGSVVEKDEGKYMPQDDEKSP